MSGPSGERCWICYYCCDPGALSDNTGICRRYPVEPTMDKTIEQTIRRVSSTNWCGEFRLHPNMGRHLSRFRPVEAYDDKVAP